MANDGGPAFPYSDVADDDPGMSLRDYFAAKAMAGYLAAPGGAGVLATENANACAEWSYLLADAMLAERSK
jgi:hypothetical protein